jgi:serine/threonine-protein kinase
MPFFTMKLVGGRTLRRALHESRSTTGRPNLAPWIGCLLKVCDALAFAHARGFVHRDLKPDNVMVGDFGEVLVMDWGLAKELGPSRRDGDGPDAGTADVTATVAGAALGSPPYMAPEQARGDAAAIDARTDVFGAGAILHEMLFGVPPYSGTGGDEIVARAARAERVRVHGRAPRELRAIVDRALPPSPAERYPSIEALLGVA